jgi:hypothetical protein
MCKACASRMARGNCLCKRELCGSTPGELLEFGGKNPVGKGPHFWSFPTLSSMFRRSCINRTTTKGAMKNVGGGIHGPLRIRPRSRAKTRAYPNDTRVDPLAIDDQPARERRGNRRAPDYEAPPGATSSGLFLFRFGFEGLAQKRRRNFVQSRLGSASTHCPLWLERGKTRG